MKQEALVTTEALDVAPKGRLSKGRYGSVLKPQSFKFPVDFIKRLDARAKHSGISRTQVLIELASWSLDELDEDGAGRREQYRKLLLRLLRAMTTEVPKREREELAAALNEELAKE